MEGNDNCLISVLFRNLFGDTRKQEKSQLWRSVSRPRFESGTSRMLRVFATFAHLLDKSASVWWQESLFHLILSIEKCQRYSTHEVAMMLRLLIRHYKFHYSSPFTAGRKRRKNSPFRLLVCTCRQIDRQLLLHICRAGRSTLWVARNAWAAVQFTPS